MLYRIIALENKNNIHFEFWRKSNINLHIKANTIPKLILNMNRGKLCIVDLKSLYLFDLNSKQRGDIEQTKLGKTKSKF